jgi:radical SAM superfamily enzyme YgiQ (UPF0313 family)
MKCLLTVPLPAVTHAAPRLPDLGLAYLAASVRRRGHDIEILDWNCRLSPAAYRDYLSKSGADVIGVKVFTPNMRGVLETLTLIREALPNVVVVAGGPHISGTRPEDLFLDLPLLDYGFRGEAENTLPAFLEALDSAGGEDLRGKDSLDGIPGLVYKDGGTVRTNPVELTDDIESLGLPAWDLIAPAGYSPQRVNPMDTRGYLAPVLATRGCPAGCTFCMAHHVNGRRVRLRDPRAFVDELEMLHREYEVRQFLVMDTNFAFDKDFLKAICNDLIERRLNMVWDSVSEENWTGSDPELYRLMYDAGCRVINIGVESADNDVRRRIRKDGKIEDVSRQVEMMRSAGIKAIGYFMFGFPGETRENMETTARFAFANPFALRSFDICMPLPGSGLHTYLKEKYGVERVDWAEYRPESSPYPLSTLSSAEVAAFVRRCRNRQLSKPTVFLRKLGRKVSRLMARQGGRNLRFRRCGAGDIAGPF